MKQVMEATHDKSQTLAAVFAGLLGGFGAHHFYLGQYIVGAIYLLLSWTGIPALIAIFETYLIAFMDRRKWAKKYNQNKIGNRVSSWLKIILLLPGVAFVLGVMLAIVIPAYRDYTDRGKMTEVILGLSACRASQSDSFATTGRFLDYDMYENCSIAYVPKMVKGYGVAVSGNVVEMSALLSDDFLKDGVISLVGRGDGNGQVHWQCISPNIKQKYMPSTCEFNQEWKISTFPFKTLEEATAERERFAQENKIREELMAAEKAKADEEAARAEEARVAAALAAAPEREEMSSNNVPLVDSVAEFMPGSSTSRLNESQVSPSFDCSKAITYAEVLICQRQDLALADRELSELYKKVYARSGNKSGLKAMMNDWRRNRRDKCRTAECIKQSYDQIAIELAAD